MKRVFLEEITINLNKKRIPLSAVERKHLSKNYPYYGAQGIIDYVDKYLFDGQYILVAEDGENLRTRNTKICNIVKGKFWVNNHAHILQAKEGYVLEYIYYKLNLINFSPYITGSAQPKLNQDNLNKIILHIPDLPTQKRIASVLSSLDSKIELNNQINAELEAMAKTIYDYWFVQFDFPYDFAKGKPCTHTEQNSGGKKCKCKPYKSSGGKMVWSEQLKREIPEGWEVGILGKNIELIIDYRGKTPKKLNSEWSENKKDTIALSAKHVKNGKLINLDSANRVSEDLYKKWMMEELAEGDILMTSEAPCGEFFYLIGKIKYCLSQRLFAIRSDSEKLHHSYLYFELSQGNGFSQILGKMSGSTVFGIRQDELRTVKILIPNRKLQNNFANLILPIYFQIRNNDYESEQLSSLRDWLLPMLMNGQVSVG